MNTEPLILSIGQALVDSIIRGFDPAPVSATGFRAESGSLFVGGEAVNQVLALARLGVKAGILCHLGKDSAGDLIEGAMRSAGTDLTALIRDDLSPTPVTTMFVAPDGTRKSITNAAHRYNFRPDRYLERLPHNGAVLIGSLFRAPFDDPGIIEKVFRASKERGLMIFADTKLPNFRFLTLDDVSASLPLIDYITPNEDEARHFTGKTEPEEMADEFLSRGVRNVIVKLGAKGCYFKNTRFSLRLPAHRIQAVDATGAGDNFIAGFASEILSGRSCEDALRFAGACGAICSTAAGAGTALRDREQVLEFLQNTPLRDI
ncbi:MAG: carbohydrate kinase family protein [Lachnospiraceae bacterium]|nr:carbohydrate kinase family protein [Lachnospiraceae bacterium]